MPTTITPTLQHFRANGKLMLTAEYLALKGATVLSVPTRFGQTLEVHFTPHPSVFDMHWISCDVNGNPWFEGRFDQNFEPLITPDAVAERLSALLKVAFAHQTLPMGHYHITTKLEFPNNWGLGSSSSLIACLAKWSGCDAFELFYATQNGSGYDVAAALHKQPVLFEKTATKPNIQLLNWQPPFNKDLAFVYLLQKQDSTKEVRAFLENTATTQAVIEKVNAITKALHQARDLATFEQELFKHEVLLSQVLQRPTVKEALFPDYPGMIKSLGAWGGDFILISKTDQYLKYFHDRGYTTVLDWDAMVL